jgi:hypothetical protein
VSEHDVQLYDDDAHLASAVADHLAAGLELGEGALALATPEHREQFRVELAARGYDVAGLEAADRLVLADAEQTVSAILGAAGTPSMTRFEQAVLPVLNRISEAGGRPHLFGEMVDLLWRIGDRRGADALEQLWCQMENRRDFALLCAYRVEDVFDRRLHLELVPQLSRTHRHVRLTADPLRLRQAFDQALAEALGPGDAARVYELAASHRGDALAHHLALTWLSAHMPRTADQVLVAARERYAAVG